MSLDTPSVKTVITVIVIAVMQISDTERRLIELLEVGVIFFLPKIWCFKIKVVFLPRK